MKKLLVGAFLGLFAVARVAVLPSQVNAQAEQSGEGGWGIAPTEYDPSVIGVGADAKDSLLKTIRSAINWVLGMLSLVALCLCLYAGFLMMTSSGDEKKYGKGIGILKWAGIGLAMIALSWLIVSMIFWLIEKVTIVEK